jgi:hypothetical protein
VLWREQRVVVEHPERVDSLRELGQSVRDILRRSVVRYFDGNDIDFFTLGQRRLLPHVTLKAFAVNDANALNRCRHEAA